MDFWVQGQPGLQSEFQDIQVYIEKAWLEKPKNKTKQNKTKQNKTKQKKKNKTWGHIPVPSDVETGDLEVKVILHYTVNSRSA